MDYAYGHAFLPVDFASRFIREMGAARGHLQKNQPARVVSFNNLSVSRSDGCPFAKRFTLLKDPRLGIWFIPGT
jgi:hypothetical protein